MTMRCRLICAFSRRFRARALGATKGQCGCLGAGEGKTPQAKLKSVDRRLDVPPVPLAMRQFIDWVANYVMSPPGLVLRQMMRVPEALNQRLR
jgi:primosomal protein N'